MVMDVLKLIDELRQNVQLALSDDHDKYDKQMAVTAAKNRLFRVRDWLWEKDIALHREEKKDE